MLRKRMGHALQRQGLPAWVVARPGLHVLAWISLIGIYPNLQYSDSQTSGPPTPVGYLGTLAGAQAGTVQPIRACPEDPWGCLSSTSALEASSPGRRRQRNSIGRQARSLQARRLTLHRPVLNPDPTLCPSERLSSRPCRQQRAHRSTSASPQAWHKLLVAVCSALLRRHLFERPSCLGKTCDRRRPSLVSTSARQARRSFRRRGQVQPSPAQLPPPNVHV